MKHLKENDKIETAYGKMKVVEFKDNTDAGWYDIAETELLDQEAQVSDKVNISDTVVIEHTKYTVTDIEIRHFTDKEAYLQLYRYNKE